MLSKLESRKECMEQIELIQHWNYFCSLAERLDDTKHYIDHKLIMEAGDIIAQKHMEEYVNRCVVKFIL